MNISSYYRSSSLILCSFLIGGFPTLLLADHAWGNYHWARSSNPVSLTLGANFSSPAEWSPFLDDAIFDWNASDELSLTRVSGGTNPRRCKPASGKIEVCSDKYGNNGWLGLAGISISGGHITSGYTKLNDTYYAAGSSYDTPAWRALVMCQEIGHDFGLGHQDESFNNANLNSCMDYTSNPESNQQPNQHDYDQLWDIYAHLDSVGDDGGSCNPRSPKCNAAQPPPAMNDIDQVGPAQWGQLVGRSADGHQEMYELDFGHGNKILTHVTWIESRGPGFKRNNKSSDH